MLFFTHKLSLPLRSYTFKLNVSENHQYKYKMCQCESYQQIYVVIDTGASFISFLYDPVYFGQSISSIQFPKNYVHIYSSNSHLYSFWDSLANFSQS